jgi:5-methylcytosine-specific restriction endonuclease McrA
LSGGELEKKLNIRQFTDTQKRTAYERQQGICPLCNTWHAFEDMEGDHITPWSKGGKTSLDNLQMICKPCNRTKSNK